jgi:hypothetical protein
VVDVVVVSVVVSPSAFGDGDGAGGASSCLRPELRSVSVCFNSAAFGWNDRVLVPMSPCATTVAICFFAQLGGEVFAVDPGAVVASKAAPITAAANMPSL